MLNLLASQDDDLLNMFAFIGFLAVIIAALSIVCFIFYKILFRKPKVSEEQLKAETVTTQSTEVQLQQEPATQPVQETPTPETNNKSGMPWFKAIIVLLIIALSIFALIKFIECQQNPNNTDGNLSLKSRSANDSDIRIDTSDDLSLTVQYILTPKVDIEDLEITFSFMDAEGNVLTRKVKQVGNVQENYDYTISISLSEFSLSEIFTIRLVDYNVTGGTVSYVQS